MISTVKQAVVVGLITAFFVSKTASLDERCTVNAEYLPNLINEVCPFYTSTSGPLTDFHQHHTCSHTHGNQIAKPRWPVYTLEPEHTNMSTCPWDVHFDEDASRYQRRIETARLVWRAFDNRTDNIDHRTRCLINSSIGCTAAKL